MGWNLWNMVSTVGAFTIAAGTLIFIYNVRKTDRHGAPAPDDPWDARTIEWLTPNPTPVYNFIEVPQVNRQDEFWHLKYSEDEEGRLIKVADGSQFVQRRAGEDEHFHMPSPSFWPLFAAVGVPVMGYGQVYRLWGVTIVGALILLCGIYAWGLEPGTEPADPEYPDEGGHGGHELTAGTAGAIGGPASEEPRELAAAGVASGGSGSAEPSGSGGASGGGDPSPPGGDSTTSLAREVERPDHG